MTNDAPSQNGPTGNTSPSLIVGLRAKDEQAWQRFLHLYGGLIYTWCRRSNLSNEDAADILQEVAATVDRNISGFRREAAGDTFRGWLRMITRNKIRDTFRAKKGDIGAVGGTKMQLRLAHLEAPSDEEDAADRKGAALRALELAHDEFEQKTLQAHWEVPTMGFDPGQAGNTYDVANAPWKSRRGGVQSRRQSLVFGWLGRTNLPARYYPRRIGKTIARPLLGQHRV